jgi:hypothetical protein
MLGDRGASLTTALLKLLLLGIAVAHADVSVNSAVSGTPPASDAVMSASTHRAAQMGVATPEDILHERGYRPGDKVTLQHSEVHCA